MPEVLLVQFPVSIAAVVTHNKMDKCTLTFTSNVQARGGGKQLPIHSYPNDVLTTCKALRGNSQQFCKMLMSILINLHHFPAPQKMALELVRNPNENVTWKN